MGGGDANLSQAQDVVDAAGVVLPPTWPIEVHPVILAGIDVHEPVQKCGVHVQVIAVQVVAPQNDPILHCGDSPQLTEGGVCQFSQA